MQPSRTSCGLVTPSSSWIVPPQMTLLAASHVPNAPRPGGPRQPPRPLIELERVRVSFPGANAQRALDAVDKNLAVADLSGLGRIGDGLHHLFDLVVVDGDVDPDLGQEVHGVFGA